MLHLIVDSSEAIATCVVGRWNENHAINAVDGGTILASSRKEMTSCTTDLPRLILSTLDTAAVSLREINRYSVVSGPGRWSGLRIGVTLVSTLAMAQAQPVEVLPKFWMLAYALSFTKRVSSDKLWVAAPARSHSVIAGCYSFSGNCIDASTDSAGLVSAASYVGASPVPSVVVEPEHMSLDEWQSRCKAAADNVTSQSDNSDIQIAWVGYDSPPACINNCIALTPCPEARDMLRAAAFRYHMHQNNSDAPATVQVEPHYGMNFQTGPRKVLV